MGDLDTNVRIDIIGHGALMLYFIGYQNSILAIIGVIVYNIQGRRRNNVYYSREGE